jgi:hypothetical protein
MQSKLLIHDQHSVKVDQESVATANEWPSVSVSPAEPVDLVQAANATSEPAFHAGDKIIVDEGPHQGVLGTFLGLEDEVRWASIKEANGTVSSHPVAWMRSHRGLLCYTTLTGREKT